MRYLSSASLVHNFLHKAQESWIGWPGQMVHYRSTFGEVCIREDAYGRFCCCRDLKLGTSSSYRLVWTPSECRSHMFDCLIYSVSHVYQSVVAKFLFIGVFCPHTRSALCPSCSFRLRHKHRCTCVTECSSFSHSTDWTFCGTGILIFPVACLLLVQNGAKLVSVPRQQTATHAAVCKLLDSFCICQI